MWFALCSVINTYRQESQQMTGRMILKAYQRVLCQRPSEELLNSQLRWGNQWVCNVHIKTMYSISGIISNSVFGSSMINAVMHSSNFVQVCVSVCPPCG